MKPTQQTQYDTLEGIKNQLIKIRDSEALQNVKADSDIAKGLAGTFSGVGGVLSDMSVKNGVLTSNSARTAVDNAKGVVPTETNPMANLQSEYAKLTKAFEQEKATRTAVEADLSIADKRLQQQQPVVAQPATPPATTPTTPASATGAQTQTGLEVLPGQENDPVAQGMAAWYNEQNAIMSGRFKEMAKVVEYEEDDMKRTVANIEAQAKSQTERIARENARLEQAARVAGIVSGRGMYSPYEHEGIISEVVQEGLARIQDIEYTKQEATIAAKKAFREFRYKAYVDATEMVQKLSDMKRQAIMDMSQRMREVELDARDKMRFDQEQADRTALIIAPELVDATPEEIMRQALANGIEPGALMREVNAYKQEQKQFGQADQEFELNMALKREQLLSSQASRIGASRGTAEGDGYDEFSKDDREYWSKELGWDIPPGVSTAVVELIEERYPEEPASVKQRIAMEMRLSGTSLNIASRRASEVNDYINNNIASEESNAEKLREYFGLKKGADLSTDPKFRAMVHEVEVTSSLDGVDFGSTKRLYEAVLAKIDSNIEAAKLAKRNAVTRENQGLYESGTTAMFPARLTEKKEDKPVASAPVRWGL